MIYLSGEVGYEINLADTISKLETGETTALITTFGGSLFEGIAMRDYLKKTKSISSIGCLGIVASSGTIIILGVEDRWAPRSTKFLIHNPSNGAFGDAAAIQKTADELKIMQNELINDYVAVSGKSFEFIEALMKEERYITAEEALSLNIINRIDTLENSMVDKKKNELLLGFKTLSAQVSAFFSQPTNLVLQSTDGTELDFGSGVETIEQIAVGVPCTHNSQLNEFVLTDGRTIKVEGNVVTEVIEAADTASEEMAQLKAENDELKARLEATNLKVSELTNKNTEFVNLKKDFLDFKNQFSKEEIDSANVPKIIDAEKPVSRIKITQK